MTGSICSRTIAPGAINQIPWEASTIYFHPISLPSTVCICLYWLGIHPFETTIELTERFWTNSSVFFFEQMTSGLQKPKLRILYFTRMGWPVLHQSKVALGAAHGAYEIHRPFFWPIVMGDSYAVASRDGAMGSTWQPDNLWAPSRRRWQTNELVQLRLIMTIKVMINVMIKLMFVTLQAEAQYCFFPGGSHRNGA